MSVIPSFFSIGPKDSAEVVDVYNPPKTPSGASSPEPTQPVDQKSTVAKNAPKAAEEAIKAIDVENGEISVNQDVAMDRLRDVLGLQSTPSSPGGQSIVDKALAKMGLPEDVNRSNIETLGKSGLPGTNILSQESKSFIRVAADGIEDVGGLIENANFETASGVKEFLDDLGATDVLNVIDNTGKFALLTGLLEKAAELKVFSILDTVLEKIDDDRDRKKFLSDNLLRFFQSADLVSINKACDYIGVGSVMARVPDGIKLIMSGYRYPRTYQGDNEKIAMFKKQNSLLIGTLNRLDSGWNTTTWNGETITDLEPYYHASFDAMAVLEYSPAHYRHAVSAKQFIVSDLKLWALRMFPQIYMASFT